MAGVNIVEVGVVDGFAVEGNVVTSSVVGFGVANKKNIII